MTDSSTGRRCKRQFVKKKRKKEKIDGRRNTNNLNRLRCNQRLFKMAASHFRAKTHNSRLSVDIFFFPPFFSLLPSQSPFSPAVAVIDSIFIRSVTVRWHIRQPVAVRVREVNWWRQLAAKLSLSNRDLLLTRDTRQKGKNK